MPNPPPPPPPLLHHVNRFPARLHSLLDEAEAGGYDRIVSWQPGGRSFRIHQPMMMVPVLRLHSRQSHYRSFLRQLQAYGFERHR